MRRKAYEPKKLLTLRILEILKEYHSRYLSVGFFEAISDLRKKRQNRGAVNFFVKKGDIAPLIFMKSAASRSACNVNIIMNLIRIENRRIFEHGK